MSRMTDWAERTQAKKDAEKQAKDQRGCNPMLVCPHCQAQGSVSTKVGKAKAGISGGKATGALLTGGVSLLATGLSRKTKITTATCHHCGLSWSI